MTAQLSCHEKIFVMITSLLPVLEQNEISIELESWWKKMFPEMRHKLQNPYLMLKVRYGISVMSFFFG